LILFSLLLLDYVLQFSLNPWVLFRHPRRILRSEWTAGLIIACVRRCPIMGSGRIFQQHVKHDQFPHKFADSRRKNKVDSASLTPKNRSTARNESPCSYNYLLLHEGGDMRVGGNKSAMQADGARDWISTLDSAPPVHFIALAH
jgi:hypothetical protein